MTLTLPTTTRHYTSAPLHTTSPVSVGLLGCGYWGPKLARNFHDLAGSPLAMICDRRQDRLDEMRERFPSVEATPDLTMLLDSDVSAVVIATPVRTHYPLAREALLAGKHVLVEKPITRHADEARELVRLAEERGLVLMVGHTFVYNPAVAKVREIIAAGELGEIFYVNSTRANLGLLQPDINVMWDLGPHDLSILEWVLDCEVVKVSARGSTFVNTRKNLSEVIYLNLSFKNGVMANLRLSWLDPVKQRNLTVVGSNKMLVYDDVAEQDKVVVYDKGVELPAYSITEEEFRASYHHGETYAPNLEWEEPLRAQCAHFLDCIQQGSVPRSDGLSGLRVVQILETAQRSLENGGVELWVEY